MPCPSSVVSTKKRGGDGSEREGVGDEGRRSERERGTNECVIVEREIVRQMSVASLLFCVLCPLFGNSSTQAFENGIAKFCTSACKIRHVYIYMGIHT